MNSHLCHMTYKSEEWGGGFWRGGTVLKGLLNFLCVFSCLSPVC